MNRPEVKLRMLLINLAILLLFFYLEGPAFGDTCPLHSVVPAKSVNERYKISAEFNKETGKWKYLWEDTKNSKILTGYLQLIESHAHLCFFITADGSRFALLDHPAGHRLNDRLFIYHSNGELLKTFGVKDLLTKGEIQKIEYTESHMRWLKYAGDMNKSYGEYDSEADILKLTTRQNRKIRISLLNAKVLEK